MSKTNVTLTGLLFVVLCLLQGCYSFTGSSLPPHLKTVAIPVFDDRSGAGTAQYRGELTRDLAARIESQSALRITPSTARADALIEGSIISFSDSPSQLSSRTERAVTNRITIVVKAVMEDRVDKKQVFSQTFVGFADYPVGNFTAKREAVRFSLNQIIDDIFDRVVSGW